MKQLEDYSHTFLCIYLYKGKEREKEKKRERERERDRQTEKGTERQRDKYIYLLVRKIGEIQALFVKDSYNLLLITLIRNTRLG